MEVNRKFVQPEPTLISLYRADAWLECRSNPCRLLKCKRKKKVISSRHKRTSTHPAPPSCLSSHQELTWRRAAGFHPEGHRTPAPPEAGTPHLRLQRTAAPVFSVFGCLSGTRGPSRSWSRSSTRSTRSLGSLWGGRRTGWSAAGLEACRGWEERSK